MDPDVLGFGLFGDLWFKIKNYHNVRMCVQEFFNPILQIGESVHEDDLKAMMSTSAFAIETLGLSRIQAV